MPEPRYWTLREVPALSDLAPIEGQLVKTPTLKVGGHVFAPIVFGKGKDRKLHKLSQREAKWIAKMLATGSEELAGQEIGVDLETSKKFAKRSGVRAFLNDMLEQKALANGLTVDKLLAKLHLAIEGELILTDTQLDSLKVAAKILRPAVTNISVTNNTQVNNAGPSPYEGMELKELSGALRSRLEDLA